MFYQEFVFFPKKDDPQAEFISEELKIKYYLSNIVNSLPDIIEEEFLHGLFEWANESKTTVEGDHFVMRLINFE